MTGFIDDETAARIRALGFTEWPVLTGPLVRLRCESCSWKRCAQPHLARELVMLGQAHITETGGHLVTAEGKPS